MPHKQEKKDIIFEMLWKTFHKKIRTGLPCIWCVTAESGFDGKQNIRDEASQKSDQNPEY